MQPIDAHVHIVGNGARGSGCWLRLGGRHRWLAKFMLRHLGLPQDTAAADFDEIYVERLLALVRESSLGSKAIMRRAAPPNIIELSSAALEEGPSR